MTSKRISRNSALTLSILLIAAAVSSAVLADTNPKPAEEPVPVDFRATALPAVGAAATLWTTDSGLTQDALLLIDQIAQVDHEGLDSSRYHLESLTSLVDQEWQPELREPLNQLLAMAFEQLVTDLGQGLVSPQKVQRSWFQEPAAVDAKVAYLSLRLPGNTVGKVIDQYRQPNPEYRRLSEALMRYRAFESNGGWPFTLPGPPIKVGEQDSRVVTVAERLQVTGDLHRRTSVERVTEANRYSPELMEAVQRFQLRHGLSPDGVIGKNTINALNTPVAVKIEKIKLNLERMRWMPHDLGSRHVITNIADYRLKVFNDGKQVLAMPIVAGKEKFKTPVFSDEIEYLVVNPTWTVPKSIIYRELLPRERREPGFLKKRNFELISENAGRVIVTDPDSLTRDELYDNHFRYVIRQKSGIGNALGKVKFIFPNKYSIYLHDTPSKSLFNRNKRAFSHGCVRLGNPQALANTLLGYQGWTKDKVDSTFRKSDRKTIRLDSPVPNHIVYLTSWEDATHGVQFREDVYGHDKDLAVALTSPTEVVWPATILTALEQKISTVELDM